MQNTSHLATILQHALTHAKKQGIDQAAASLVCELGFSVAARMGDVETLEHHQGKALDVTVYHQQRSGSASTTDLSLPAVQAAVEKACAISRYTGEDTFSGLADADLMAYDYPDLQLYHPWSVTPEQAIDLAIRCETLARQHDERIKQSEEATVSTYDIFRCYGNTHGFQGSYWKSEHSIHCSVIAEADNHMERESEYTIARDSTQLTAIEVLAQQVAEKTLARLGARRLKTQRCPVIFHAEVARGLFGHFIAAISGVNLYHDNSFLCHQLHQTIFPTAITIYQDPHQIGDMGSTPFDAEGVRTQPISYVDQGVLVNYSLGSYSARKLGMKTTGNSGGVYNLHVKSSATDFQALLQQMGTGLLVMDLMGQGVHILTGNYSRGATGFWVENGVIRYPVHEITIAGNLKDMFKNIVAIANDVDYRGNIKTGSVLITEMTVAGE